MTTETYHDICLYLRGLIKDTQWEGHIFTVGGCCRDLIMQQPIKDVDLAVTLPDGGIAFAMWLHEKGLTTCEPTTFPRYGTARLELKEFPGDELELVQTRKEKYTDKNSRDPSTAFGSIEEDCYRRDLTINSLYYDISNDRLLDITGQGQADMKAQIIRTPSDPDTTFDDDPVRILRAIRFAAKYGWNIDPAAMEAMCRYSSRLDIISPERMQGEFDKILLSPRPGMALELLRQTGAMPHIIPELAPAFEMEQAEYHFGTVWQHTIAVVDKVPADLLLRLAALLHDIGKTVARVTNDGKIRFPRHDKRCKGLIGAALNRLHYRSSFIDRVIFLCIHHEVAKSWGPDAEKMSDADLRKLQHLCHTQRRFDNLLTLIDADNRSYTEGNCMPGQTTAIRRRSDELRREGTAMFSYSLPVKPSRIRRIKRINSESVYEDCLRFLMNLAYENPRIAREEMVRRLEKFKPTAAAPTKPKRKKKHRRQA